VRHTQWTEWDYVLLEAAETIEMLESPATGQLRTLSEDPDVYWEIDYRVDYAAQELERFHKEHDTEPGVNLFLTNPQKREGKPFWTVSDWLDNIEEGNPRIEREAPDGSHAPNPEDLIALMERRRKAASAE
jgi:hypothetical protein